MKINEIYTARMAVLIGENVIIVCPGLLQTLIGSILGASMLCTGLLFLFIHIFIDAKYSVSYNPCTRSAITKTESFTRKDIIYLRHN